MGAKSLCGLAINLVGKVVGEVIKKPCWMREASSRACPKDVDRSPYAYVIGSDMGYLN